MTRKRSPHRPVYDKPPEKVESHEADHHAGDCCSDSSAKILTLKELLRALVDHLESESQKAEKSDAKKFKLDVGTLSIVGVYTALTLDLFILVFCQLRIANSQAVAQTRAWLYPRDFSFGGNIETASDIHITANTENVGHEPAIGPAFSPDGEFGFIDIPQNALVISV